MLKIVLNRIVQIIRKKNRYIIVENNSMYFTKEKVLLMLTKRFKKTKKRTAVKYIRARSYLRKVARFFSRKAVFSHRNI